MITRSLPWILAATAAATLTLTLAQADDEPEAALYGVWAPMPGQDLPSGEAATIRLHIEPGWMSIYEAGELDERVTWSLGSFAGDILFIDVKEVHDDRPERIYMTVAGDLMTWAEEGSTRTLTWKIQRGETPKAPSKAELRKRQLDAARVEGRANVDGIRTAEKAYHAEWDSFTAISTCPPGPIGADPQTWDRSWPCVSQFENLGWLPDGQARCRYEVSIHEGYGGMDDFTITSTCDVDGDGTPSIYRANRADKAQMVTPADVY